MTRSLETRQLVADQTYGIAEETPDALVNLVHCQYAAIYFLTLIVEARKL